MRTKSRDRLYGTPVRIAVQRAATTISSVCNLYSVTTNQAAIIALFRVGTRYVGDLPPMPGAFPDYPATVTRNTDAGTEVITVRLVMPSPQRTVAGRMTDMLLILPIRLVLLLYLCLLPLGLGDSRDDNRLRRGSRFGSQTNFSPIFCFAIGAWGSLCSVGWERRLVSSALE